MPVSVYLPTTDIGSLLFIRWQTGHLSKESKKNKKYSLSKHFLLIFIYLSRWGKSLDMKALWKAWLKGGTQVRFASGLTVCHMSSHLWFFRLLSLNNTHQPFIVHNSFNPIPALSGANLLPPLSQFGFPVTTPVLRWSCLDKRNALFQRRKNLRCFWFIK